MIKLYSVYSGLFLLKRYSKIFGGYLVILLGLNLLVVSPMVFAAATITVSPSTNLSNNQSVSISGSGLAIKSTGSILECNNTPNQPTIDVAGSPVPVSCTNPLLDILTTSSTGTLPTTASFKVHEGTVGPPAVGTDSNGASSSSDAALYPCPPTPAQLAAGYSCDITFGDANGDDVIQNITFANQSVSSGTTSTATPATNAVAPNSSGTTTTTNKATPTTASTVTQPKTSSLVNTGPGNVFLVFAITAVAATLLRYAYIRFYKKSYLN